MLGAFFLRLAPLRRVLFRAARFVVGRLRAVLVRLRGVGRFGGWRAIYW